MPNAVSALVTWFERCKQTLQVSAKMVVQLGSMPGSMFPMAVQNAANFPPWILIGHGSQNRLASVEAMSKSDKSRVVKELLLYI